MPLRIAHFTAPLVFAILVSVSGATVADSPSLSLPIVCGDDKNCYIQSLVDRDGTEGASDFTCGTLTYNGHKGVDFRVSTLEELRKGVPVVAAAPGRVRSVRDGVPDTGKAGMTPGKDCGNGVVLDHGVSIELTRPAAEWIADKGYDDRMGARPLGRVIQEHIKKPLAEELLFGKLAKGGLVVVKVKEGDLFLDIAPPDKKRISGDKTPLLTAE